VKASGFKSGFCVVAIVVLSACSSSNHDGATDSGTTDSGTADSGTADSGTADSGTADSGTADSGTADSGTADSGTADSGTTDSGTADSGTTDSGTVEPTLQVSCEVVTDAQLQNSGGVVNTVLPADLSAAGAQIDIQLQPSGQLTAFDAQSGAVDYVPGSSKLSSSIIYLVKDAQGTVLASHEHRWIAQPVRIMPLGDSITSGVEFFDGSVDLPPMPERVGYRKFLFDRLAVEGYPVDFHGQGGQSAGAAAGLADPENNGYPGVDIDFLNGKLTEQLTEDAVDIILLHIGTNNTPSNAAGIDVWLDELDSWEAVNNPVIAMVATIVPKRDETKNAQVNLFNADLRQRIQARTNDKVFLVDQNAAVSVADISSESIGLHPNAGGYQKMADTWFDGLINSGALSKCN